MTSTLKRRRSAPGGRSLVAASLALIIALFVTMNGVEMYRALELRQLARDTVDDALASVELVGRLGRDLDRERILLGDHVLAARSQDWEALERRLAEVDADFQRTAAAYEPLVRYPGEAEAWHRLQAGVTAIRGPVARLLRVSRGNEDDRARVQLLALEPAFDAIDAESAQVIAINREAANAAAKRVEWLLYSSVVLLGVLTASALALTLAIGSWTTRLVGRREAERERYANLLEARNRELDAFAGRVAHDLRGPLTGIRLAAAKLARQDPSAAFAAPFERGVARMDQLIRDLLALSRVDADAARDASNPARAAEIVREDLAERVSHEGGVMRIAVEPAAVVCSEGLLVQVLTNLVDNGLKYRRADVAPAIEVRGEVTGDRYELCVSDNGIGMSPDEAAHAFLPLFRAQRALGVQGTGLGLAIVKRAVEVNGGTVRVESALGKGTTFVVELPLAGGARRAARR